MRVLISCGTPTWEDAWASLFPTPQFRTPYCRPYRTLGHDPGSRVPVIVTNCKGSQGISWRWAWQWPCLVPAWWIQSASNDRHPLTLRIPHQCPWTTRTTSQSVIRERSQSLSCWLSLESSPSCWKYSQDPRLHTSDKANLQSIFEIPRQLLMYSTGCDKWVSV